MKITPSNRLTPTYPIGPHQEEGNPLWEQDSIFQPWSQGAFDNPFWGMAMYAGFVEAKHLAWSPSYQPGMPTQRYGQHLGMYSGFVNEHSLKGI